MYDPVLNRPMFQGPSSTDQGPSAPSAKGTGITSMVTAPDQGAQQLRSFANPTIQPTIRGFADGGFLGGGQSSPLPEGPMSGNPIQTAVSQAVDQAVINPVPNFANGGPVQHFQEGGVASMWDNFVNSLTIKGETKSPFQGPTPMKSGNYRLPDVGLRIGQPSTDYRKDAAITDGTPNYVEPIDIGGPRAVYDESLRNPELYGETPITRPGIEEMARVNPAPTRGEFPIPREEAPSRIDDREAARGAGFRNIEQQPRPPMPGPGFETETTVNPASEKPRGAISTHLSDIKAERASQSAADRRENALMALMSAGFGMAAGKSRHALANIAEGGQQGIGTFAQLEKGRREDENRRYLSALHEKEVALRERDLEARLPLIAAQTEAQKSIPAYREQQNENRKFTANVNAVAKVEAAMGKIMGNPTDPRAREILADKTNTKKAILEKQLHEKFFIEELRKPTESSQSDPYGIR